MGVDDQREEREVLDSIFPEEITDVADNAYRIAIELEPPKENGDETEDPTILLNVRYPEAYPDEAPHLDITAPPNAPRHPHLDIQDDKAALLAALAPTIEENLGMAMVFTLVMALKDAAESLIGERAAAVQAAREAALRRAEQEENRKFEGEKVTPATFTEWRERFRKEMAEEAARRQAELEAEEKKKRGGKAEEKKLTGKQLWEQGLAGKAAEEDEEGEDIVAGMRAVKVEG